MSDSQLFKDVVVTGLQCGLEDPREWLRNYERSLPQFCRYEDIPYIEKDLKHVRRELYECTHFPPVSEGISDEEIYDWVWTYL